MIFRRDAIDKVRLYVAVGDFSRARYWLKRVHLDWLPELLVDPSQIVRKMASRRIKHWEVANCLSVRRGSSMHKRSRVRGQRWQAKIESSERGTVGKWPLPC